MARASSAGVRGELEEIRKTTAIVANRPPLSALIMKFLNDVKSARPVGDYRLRATFQDGYVGEVDLWPLFAEPKGPLTETFADPQFFQKVYVDPETHVVAWPNGYDICSDVLRYYCEQGRVASREEMNAYFTEEIEATVLKDAPEEKRPK
jgi:hypothetical protein